MATLYTHPLYSEKQGDWQRYQDLYAGKHDVLSSTKYLHPHALESIQGNQNSINLRKSREERTRYLNTVEIIISLWLSFFFRKPPSPDKSVMTMLGDDYYDIDGKGNSLFSFVKNRILQTYLLNGRADVLVDAKNEQAANLAEQRAKGLRPFWELIDPLARKDWDIETDNPNRIGQYNMFRHEYLVYLPRSNSTEQPSYQHRSKVLRLDGARYVIDLYRAKEQKDGKPSLIGNEESWELNGIIETDLTELPVAYLEGDSWVHDVCEETIRFHNIRSMRDNVNFFQGYQKTFIVGDKDQGLEKALTEFTVSFLDEGANVIFGPSNDPIGLEKAQDESLLNVFRLGLDQISHLPSDSRQTQSAEAKIEDKWSTFALVESTIQEIEGVVDRSLRFHAQFKGANDFEGSINLNKDIAEKDITSFITLWTAFADKLSQYPDIEKAALSEAVKGLGFDEKTTSNALRQIKKGETKQLKTGQEVDPVASAIDG